MAAEGRGEGREHCHGALRIQRKDPHMMIGSWLARVGGLGLRFCGPLQKPKLPSWGWLGLVFLVSLCVAIDDISVCPHGKEIQ